MVRSGEVMMCGKVIEVMYVMWVCTTNLATLFNRNFGLENFVFLRVLWYMLLMCK